MYPICFLYLFFCFQIKVLFLTVHIYFAVPAFGLGKGDGMNAAEDVEIGKFYNIARILCD
jgi:hypothetical protein